MNLKGIVIDAQLHGYKEHAWIVECLKRTWWQPPRIDQQISLMSTLHRSDNDRSVLHPVKIREKRYGIDGLRLCGRVHRRYPVTSANPLSLQGILPFSCSTGYEWVQLQHYALRAGIKGSERFSRNLDLVAGQEFRDKGDPDQRTVTLNHWFDGEFRRWCPVKSPSAVSRQPPPRSGNHAPPAGYSRPQRPKLFYPPTSCPRSPHNRPQPPFLLYTCS